MTHKNYPLISVLAAIGLIPQLLFWWLAPAAATARFAVYIGGTILTMGIPTVYFLTYRDSNLQKTAGLSVVCGILEIMVVALAALLLGMNVSSRSAIFAFLIAALVCLIVLIPMISSIRKPQRQGVYPAAIPTEPDNLSTPVMPTRTGPISAQPPSSSVPRPAPPGNPLPPRNR